MVAEMLDLLDLLDFPCFFGHPCGMVVGIVGIVGFPLLFGALLGMVVGIVGNCWISPAFWDPGGGGC